MTTLTVPAPAKLNLNLRITGRREDGLHLLEGVMTLIDFADSVRLSKRDDGAIRRDWRHKDVPAEADLSLQAARRLQAAAGCRRAGASIRIEKHIPVGGGLGGASSNAAAALLGLNRLWNLNWPQERLLDIARALGADVAFFLYGRPAAVSGIGDVFQPAAINLRHRYLLVFPPAAAMTAAVYAEYDRMPGGAPLPSFWQKSANDLTAAAARLHPPIASAAKMLYNTAREARLSGSGSTVFAEFADESAARQARQRLPGAVSSVLAAPLPNHPFINQ